MTRWSVRPLLWALPVLPLLTPPAPAASITTYGSIIITALGNDTFKIEYADQPHPELCDDEKLPPGGGPSDSIDETPPPLGDGSSTPGLGGTGIPDDDVSVPKADDSFPDLGPPSPGVGDEVPPPPIGPFGPESDDETVGGPDDELDFLDSDGVDPGIKPTETAQTPEPASLTLLALGGLGGWVYTRRRRA